MTRVLGNYGEDRVAAYLQEQGFSIVVRNFSIRSGEIDIIATKDDLLVFVEVKARTMPTDNLSEIVTYSKQRKIVNTAKYFLSTHSHIYSTYDYICRFDIALINGDCAPINYLPGAFTSGE